MKSTVLKRSVAIAGQKTSVSLEDAFWDGLKVIAGERHMTLSELVTSVDSDRQHTNLSSAIRLFVLNYYQSPRNDEGRVLHATPNRTAPHLRRVAKRSALEGSVT
jgi:predicted DNA-binding ribbon-helix-helix protein